MSRSTSARRNRASGAFTLIELLAVVSIILLLLSMLMPSMGQMRQIARETQCLSNLKQLGAAVMSHASDREGQLTHYANMPECVADGQANGAWNTYGWFKWAVVPFHSLMLSYYSINNGYYCGAAFAYREKFIRDARAFYCPADNRRHAVLDKTDPNWSDGGFFANGEPGKVWMSYYFNPMQIFRLSDVFTQRLGGGYSVTEYPLHYTPAAGVLMMDPIIIQDGSARDGSLQFHNQKWNMVHYDGHADKRQSAELVARLAAGVRVDEDWTKFDENIKLLCPTNR